MSKKTRAKKTSLIGVGVALIGVGYQSIQAGDMKWGSALVLLGLGAVYAYHVAEEYQIETIVDDLLTGSENTGNKNESE